MREISKIDFEQHGDERGQLISLEECKNIPFNIKRVYYMYDTGTGISRGFHAHKSLQQVFVCVHGCCKIRLDDGQRSMVVQLDKPYEGMYVRNPVWREIFDFSPDAVLMVLASEFYSEDDYIRDYNEFLEYVRNVEDK